MTLPRRSFAPAGQAVNPPRRGERLRLDAPGLQPFKPCSGVRPPMPAPAIHRPEWT